MGLRYVYVPFIEVTVCDPKARYLCNPSSCVPQNNKERIGCGVILEGCLELFYLFIAEWMSVCFGTACTFYQKA